MSDQKTYKFKWTNIDLKEYIAGRRRVAEQMKVEARILISKADKIIEETYELEDNLIEIEHETPAVQPLPR
jgi:hypothetical protein